MTSLTAPGSKVFRFDIQALRALAVVAVVFFHAFPEQFPGGYLGVDVFFVISGFVVTPLIFRIFEDPTTRFRTRVRQLGSFFFRRFLRLAPPLALMISVMSVVYVILAPPSIHHMFASQALTALLLAGNVGADKFSGNYFLPAPNPLIHTWSLSVEEQIYLALPLILLVLFQKRWAKPKTLLVWTLVSLILLGFIAFEFPTLLGPLYLGSGLGLNADFSFYSPLERIWEFAVGGYVWALGSRQRSPKSYAVFLVSSIALFVLAASLFAPGVIPNSMSTPLVVAATGTVIRFHSVKIRKGVINSLAMWLGDRSYSIYLWHMPLLYIAVWSQATALPSTDDRKIQIFLALVITALLANLSFKYIEQRRGTAYVRPITGKRLTFLAVTNGLIPLAFIALIFQGLGASYWGFDRNIPVPSYAGFLDPTCARDSDGGGPCEYPVSHQRGTALLLGDSHAGMLSQAFIDAAHENQLTAVVWTHSGCPVVVKSMRAEYKPSCIQANKTMISWLVHHTPDVVVLSEYVRDNSPLQALLDAAKSIAANSTRKIIIVNPPIFPDSSEFMVSRPMIMKPYQPAKVVPLKIMNIRDIASSDRFARSANLLGFETVDVKSAFCNSNACTRFAKGNWLYRDDNHLSTEGANLVTKIMSRQLAAPTRQ
jgi:peptidoglycan/LPS O-acetylase OafA/YrhL